jgi:hypothetical protein
MTKELEAFDVKVKADINIINTLIIEVDKKLKMATEILSSSSLQKCLANDSPADEKMLRIGRSITDLSKNLEKFRQQTFDISMVHSKLDKESNKNRKIKIFA